MPIHPKQLRRIAPALFLLSALSTAWGAARDEIAVTFAAGDNIRALAQTHLHNPDLWPDILHANGLQSVHELRPGIALKIPVRLILAVDGQVREAQNVIGEASRQGARALDADTINQAIQAHQEALDWRRKGAWEKALKHAGTALEAARRALAETKRQRNQSVEAVLENLGGTVQRRPPGTWSWRKAEIKSMLAEQEKLRTLSSSFAAVRFSDASRLRLNANAELLIQKMRMDGLNRRKDTGVVLQGGDIYALLGGNAGGREFDVHVEGVETDIESNNFWIDRSAGTTRLANYDGKIEVKARGAAVVVGKNQGTLVRANRQPSPPKDLLPAPDKLLPADYSVIYANTVVLEWNAPPEAAAYWLEIATDREFKELQANQPKLVDSRFTFSIPDNGLYYWRVATVDNDGLPGPKSKLKFFKAQFDREPPYLVVTTPLQGVVVAESPLQIHGQTEHGANLECNGAQQELDAVGAFTCSQELQPGRNQVVVVATDPAGNHTRLERQVEYLALETVPLSFGEDLPRVEPAHFVVDHSEVTVHGLTLPKAALTLKNTGADAEQAAFADQVGRFQINLALTEDTQEFVLTATLPTGKSRSEPFTISRDLEPPAIRLEPLPPALVAEPELRIEGKVTGAVKLYLDKTELELDSDGTFRHTLQLHPGANPLHLKARDLAGNRTQLQRQVVLDQEAPEFLGHALSQRTARAGAQLKIEVKARDTNGLKAGAPYRLQIGTQTRNGFLRLSADRATYRDEIQLPPDAQGKLTLVSVELEDYAGNRKAYQP